MSIAFYSYRNCIMWLHNGWNFGATPFHNQNFSFIFFPFDRDVHGICTRKDKIMAAAMAVLAVITSAIAISTNLYNFIGAKS